MENKVERPLALPSKSRAGGSATAEEIYYAVGEALTAWEACQDQLVSLMEELIGRENVIGREAFVRSDSRNRVNMVNFYALKVYIDRLRGGDSKALKDALKKLIKLGEVRNEIAHGAVYRLRAIQGGGEPVRGFFLLPSYVARRWEDRSFKTAHDGATIRDFSEQVRMLGDVVRNHSVALRAASQRRTKLSRIIISLSKALQDPDARPIDDEELLQALGVQTSPKK